ncbi:MAG: hypothetical protein DRP00_00105 [Candidatus Aenigmatarchaeota archaeon]|nr:MAG: hypothetical protein DRP00_00105 [Candidatus Aenigmarchaeota archaeon]
MSKLGWKEAPTVELRPIIYLVRHKDKYDVDRTYQKAPGIWTKKMEQHLIDSILRGYPVPPIIIHKKGDKKFIVDGQQRWFTIMKFANDELELSKEYSEDIIADNGGKTKYSELSDEWQNRFDSYPITLYYLEDYNDEEIRSTFLRLQEAKPLTPGERLNAYPGDIVLAVRKLGDHEFFYKSIAIGVNRYGNIKLAATFLYLEKEGIKDISPQYLYEFFKHNRNLSETSKEYKKVKKTLDYLRKAFDSRTPELRSEAWVVSVYLLASRLIEEYVVTGKHRDLKEFLVNFYSLVEKAKEGGDKELLDFREAVMKGTTMRDAIDLRLKIMLKRFLKQYIIPQGLMKIDSSPLNKRERYLGETADAVKFVVRS